MRQGFGQLRHRVGVVEDDGVGGKAVDSIGQVYEDWDVAQSSSPAARADGVAYRVVDAVVLRDGQVMGHGWQAAGRDGNDDEIGVLQSLIGVGLAFDGCRNANLFHQLL